MPNGTPFNTGFKQVYTGVDFVCNKDCILYPQETQSKTQDWLYEDYDDITTLSSTGEMTAAIKSDGTLWTWGRNSYSLGDNSTINKSSPVQTVSQGTNWKQVCVGGIQIVGSIKTDGTLWVWGYGNNGVLGDNSTINKSSPVQTVSQGTNWKNLSFSSNQSAAIKTDGTLWVWGSGTDGKLGNLSVGNQSSPVQTVSTGTNWKQVSISNIGPGAIKCDGTLWVWGFNNFGGLATNTTISHSSPVQTISQGTNWKNISGGDSSFAAIKTDGTLWLWGAANFGRLGNNDATNNRSSPVQTISTGTNWRQVNARRNFVSSIKTDGTLWLWGYNSQGQLGNNNQLNQSSPVQTVSQGTDWKLAANGRALKIDGTLWVWGGAFSNGGYALGTNDTISRSSPSQTVSATTNWTEECAWCAFSAGYGHSAAIKSDGTLWTWGRNNFGYLGINSTINQSSPVQTVSTGTNWKQVSVGGAHTAAIKTDGTLWLWGCNTYGRLGAGSYTHQSSPVQTVSQGTNWKQVSLGWQTSGAVKTDGTLWMWGSNVYGQIGDNSNLAIPYSSPVQTVSTGTNWKQVSVGCVHSAAIKTDGTLWLWGRSNFGQLGTNSNITQSSPVQTVSTGNNWKQVRVNCLHSAAIKTDGTLWLWGANNDGKLGNNNTIPRSSPVQTVSTGTNWKQVDLSRFFTSAVKTDGTLWSWGNGFGSMLGTNSNINQSSPVQTLTSGTDWKQVAAGQYHALGLKNSNQLFGWGSNSYGQLNCFPRVPYTANVTTDIGNILLEKEYLLDQYPNLVPWMKSPALWISGINICGQLGTNDTLSRSSPTQTITFGTNWKQAASGNTATAAIKTDGTLWSWGGSAILGDNSSIAKSSPVQTVSQGTNWSQVTANHQASFAAIKTDGTLWLWGVAAGGILGDNKTLTQSSPVQTVSTGTNWKQVTMGNSHGGSVKCDGTLWMWGNSFAGVLGNLTGTVGLNFSSPVQTVSTGTNWKQVSVSAFSSAAIKTDGTLWTWGSGIYGELGNGRGGFTSEARSSPVQTVSTGTNWKQVSVGGPYMAAIKTDGTLWTWGGGNANQGHGQLGNNTLRQCRCSPVQTVSTGTNWKKVSLGFYSASAIKTDGTLWVWGRNSDGQLMTNDTISRSYPVQTVSQGTNWKDVDMKGCFNMVTIREDNDW